MLKDILSKLKLSNYHNDIDRYVNLLTLENRRMNLFSRKITKDILLKEHIEDCLLPYNYFEAYNSITDIGSGGGLPGILLSIIFPQKEILLVEKSPKKVSFLENVKQKLNLKNLQIILNNVENIYINSEVVTCRAFKSIYETINLTNNFFNNNGIYIFYKGRMEKIKEEINECKNINFNYHIHRLKNDFNKERHIVIIKKG